MIFLHQRRVQIREILENFPTPFCLLFLDLRSVKYCPHLCGLSRCLPFSQVVRLTLLDVMQVTEENNMLVYVEYSAALGLLQGTSPSRPSDRQLWNSLLSHHRLDADENTEIRNHWPIAELRHHVVLQYILAERLLVFSASFLHFPALGGLSRTLTFLASTPSFLTNQADSLSPSTIKIHSHLCYHHSI